MTEIEKMKRYIERTKFSSRAVNHYYLNWTEVGLLRDEMCRDPFRALCLAFDYGKAKGYRSAKAEGRAKS